MAETLRSEHKKLLLEIEGLLSLISQPILVVDSAGHVVHVNSSAEDTWGRSQISIMNKNLNDLVLSPSLLEHIRRGKPLSDYTVKIIGLSGKHLNYTCRLYPLIVDRSVEGAILIFSKQITPKELEKEQEYVTRYSFADIRGNSEIITELKKQAETIAKGDSTILIRGESGTGKEVLAQSIHRASFRKNGPFVAINCAAIPESLLESELFGYEEGAFTGAKKGGKPGRFELARGGTLFLDEIGDMPLYLQAKLLRVLQEKKVERVGGTENVRVDVRIIAATHKDLEAMIANRQFREDLFYRLNVIPLYVPALRERKEDLYELIQYYMRVYSERLGKKPKRFSSQALMKLYHYHWPGNIRELENIIEYIVNLEIGELVTISSLPNMIQHSVKSEDVMAATPTPVTRPLRVDETEEQLILEALGRYGNSTEGKKQAAAALGISVATLYRKLRKMRNVHLSN